MTTKQRSLFGFDVYGATSPTIAEARAARDDALDAVEAVQGADFKSRASAFVLRFLWDGPASGEDITDACVKAGIVPDNPKAFGPILMALSREGKIEKAGFAQRRKGHGTSGANLWKLRWEDSQ